MVLAEDHDAVEALEALAEDQYAVANDEFYAISPKVAFARYDIARR